MLKIMLDAGHGSGKQYNRGFKQVGNYSHCNEGDCNFLYAKYYLKPELEKYGFKVGLTRNKIEDNPTLYQRGRLAIGYDLLISCHTNGANGKATGVEVWDSTNPKESIKELTDLICQNISETLGIVDRGTKYRKLSNGNNYYGILRFGMAKRNFIIEHCFHDNISDVTKYRMNLDNVAQAVAKAIADFYGVKKKTSLNGGKFESLEKTDTNTLVGGGTSKMSDTVYYSEGDIQVIKTTADNIYIQQLKGKTLAQIGAVGVNGTFFNTSRPELPQSTWSISINNGYAVGSNANRNHPDKKVKRGTIVFDGQKTSIQYVNLASEIKGKISWAIGGVGIYPRYDPQSERVPHDILSTTAHTWIGFKDNIVFLCVSSRISISEIIAWAKRNTDGCVLLDGGGSSQMFWKTGPKLHTSRKLNTIVGVKRV